VPNLGLDYPTKWGRSPGVRVIRNLIHITFLVPYTRYLSTLEVRGLDTIQGAGPFIFTANHTSNMDTPLVIAALPGKIRRHLVVAAAMDNFFMESGRAFRTVLVFNAIPIDRHKVNRRSAQIAFELVEENWNLLIYPEGGRTPDGDLHEFKGGAAYLADRTQKPVIPMYIHESGWLQGPKYAKAPRFTSAPDQHRHHVIVSFGDAIHIEEGENIRRFNNRILDAVEHLGREVSGDAAYGVTPVEGL
jgi:1-acyl-sn-glycerol-3-phosphate acyltransferase